MAVEAQGGVRQTAIGDAVVGATQGSVLFVGAGGTINQDNANLFWDDANNRLGIRTNAPADALDLRGMLREGGGVPGVANGAGSTGAALVANSSDLAGRISGTTVAATGADAILCTITFSAALPRIPMCVFCQTAATIATGFNVYSRASDNTASILTLRVSTYPAGATAYVIEYLVIE